MSTRTIRQHRPGPMAMVTHKRSLRNLKPTKVSLCWMRPAHLQMSRIQADLSLLNTAREKLEGIIDTLHAPHKGEMKKPRDRRRQARRDYLRTAKNRKPSRSEMRKAIGRQLRYVAWDLRFIEQLVSHTPLTELPRRQYRDLLVIGELYHQQQEMYQSRTFITDSWGHQKRYVIGFAKQAITTSFLPHTGSI